MTEPVQPDNYLHRADGMRRDVHRVKCISVSIFTGKDKTI